MPEHPAEASVHAPGRAWPGTGADVARLARLRVRHLRRKSASWAAVVGVDTESNSLGNRLYGLYLGVLLLVWLWFMWGAAFDAAFAFGESLTPPAREGLRTSLTLLPIRALVAFAIGTLRSSPVKFFSADMAYVAGTPVSRPAVAAVWSVAGTIKSALVGGAFAALACAVLAEAATSPLAFSACAPAAALGGSLPSALMRGVGRWDLHASRSGRSSAAGVFSCLRP